MVAHSQSTGTVIVGQRALFREGVAALLRHTPYKVISTAERSSELRNVRASGSRTLVILGVDDETESASAVSENIKTLRSLFPGGTIVVIAETRSSASFEQIIMAAPDGYVSNLKSRDVLLKLLDVVLLDQQVIVLSRPAPASTAVDEGDSGKCANPRNSIAVDDRQCLSVRSVGAKDPQLSQREREILLRLAEGESNKQIARLCNITESTVKVHLKAILRKITVHNRTQAAIWAIAKGYHIMAVPGRVPKPMHGIDDRSSIQGPTPSNNGGLVGLEVSGK